MLLGGGFGRCVVARALRLRLRAGGRGRTPRRRRRRRSPRRRGAPSRSRRMKASGVRSPPASAAMIAPMIATPIVPPTCRALFSTAEPDARLVDRNAPRRRGGARRHRQRHADPADQERREEIPERRVVAEPREHDELDGDEDHPRRHQPARPDPVARPSRRSGATRMIRIVIGRNAAPVCTGE